jgi:hypothetical protein
MATYLFRLFGVDGAINTGCSPDCEREEELQKKEEEKGRTK